MIFFFNGPPGSGKDYCCQNLPQETLNFKKILIEHTIEYFGVAREWFISEYNNRNVKETPEELLGGISRRDALIHVSENIYKKKYGNTYFGEKVLDQIEDGKDYVFSDCGFIDEIFPIINKIGEENAVIIQLFRDGCDFSKDSRSYIQGKTKGEFILSHKTEYQDEIKSIYPYQCSTYKIHNNASEEELIFTAKKIIKKEKNVS